MKLKYLIIACVFIFFSCKKKENRSCWKSAGKQIEKTIPLSDFTQVEIYKNLKCVLIQDSLNQIVVKGGENLVNLVSVKCEDYKLTLRNLNKCNFVRKYKNNEIVIEIHFRDLINIEYYGSEELTNIGEISTSYLVVSMIECAGKINLKINTNSFSGLVSGGFGNFEFSGHSNFTHFNVNGNGFCNAFDLITKDSIYVVSNTSAPLRVNVDQCLFKSQIKKNGDVLYKGSPLKSMLENIGTGKYIKID